MDVMTKMITEELYREHHRIGSREGFSYFEGQRARELIKLIGTGKKVLDLGCRDGTLTQYFITGNEVLGVDIDKKLLLKAHDRFGIQTKHYDLNAPTWPFKKDYYDVVVAGEVLEHLFNLEAVVKRIRALLSDDGMFVGSVPNAFHILDRLRFILGKVPRSYSDPTHVNMFSVTLLQSLLSPHFPKVSIIPITVDKFQLLANMFPSLFADDLFFVAWV